MKLVKKRERVSSSIYKHLKVDVKKYSVKRRVSQSRYIEQAIREKVAKDREIYK